MDRRHALSVLSGLAAAGLTGCGGAPPLRIAVVWSGWELSRFNRVLENQAVTVYSAGDNIAALLGKSVASAATPDVAIVPRPGLVSDPVVCARLHPLPSGDPPFWQELLRCGEDGRTNGVWFKIAHKSLVWYRPEAVPAPPADWDAWVELCRERAAAKNGRPPLSIAAADGWVLTDWFENVLLGIDPVTYGTLHRTAGDWSHGSVREALTRLAELWRIENLVPGGGRQALVTQFHDSILDVFRYGRADMLAAPDFAWPVIDRYRSPGQGAWRFRFPGPAGRPAPRVVVGGDAVVALKSSGERGRRFVEWLTGEEAGERLGAWAAAGGFLSLNKNVHGYPAPIRDLAAELEESVEFDLSDRLTGGLAGGDGQGLWRVLTDLFIAVAVNGQPSGDAAESAMRAIASLVEKRPS
ncbi:ABC transporter substrate-binding protein [Streptosporangium sp. NBC_01639]|uniref:ABC transporter substrate-binding protein n=2 Tax=unclassified Streptosporangium TaxID=2632669 RepID=UPI002DD8EC7C|nr:ABC transporter substrate-binding protein [Streptosporangium sp. NBC_01756]WSC85815.1 ABC transporter substrate-binding protein [Streptosporangium sp. NBC_01756]WTD58845.1 ABC transporter substrate-binding protein [Streptosporangium sp. NBC_01639]